MTLPASEAGDVRLTLLNSFELILGAEPLLLRPSGQRVVAFLALRARRVQRSLMAGMLWPDSPDDHANQSLRSAIWRVNGPAHALVGRDVVESSRTHLRLAPHVRVDLHEAMDEARRLIAGRSEDGGTVGELLRRSLTADLLPDWDEDWVVAERERVRHLRLHALETLCEGLTARGRYAEAIEAGMAAVESEPLRESAQVMLIRAHMAEGNVVEAIRQYASYRRLLTDELGIVPSVGLEELVPALRI